MSLYVKLGSRRLAIVTQDPADFAKIPAACELRDSSPVAAKKENAMRRYAWTGLMTVLLAGAPMLVGCDKKLAEDSTTHTNPDGSVSKDSTTVTQQPDGTVVKTQDQSKTPATSP
jgi:hypothetical protein